MQRADLKGALNWAGAVTFLMMLLSRFIFRKYGWGVAAQITPTVLLITGIAFFGLVLFSGARPEQGTHARGYTRLACSVSPSCG